MKNKKGILIVSGAGVVLVAAALLIFAVPALAGEPTKVVQGASGCIVTDAQGNVSCPMANNASQYGNDTQGQVSCPMANGSSQDATVDPNTSGGSCH